jgi:transcriptional regulator with XRE-family HTH domain
MKADELRKALDDLGLSQTQLASDVGVSRRLVVYWLAGARRIPAEVVKLVRKARRRGWW